MNENQNAAEAQSKSMATGQPINKNAPGQEQDPNQTVEQQSYTPTYKIKPEFKNDVLKAIGDRPFNEIAGLVNAISTTEIDHQMFQQVVNALGQFSYNKVAPIIQNINSYVEQKLD